MKTCFKCHVEKPFSDFYKHSETKDGYLNKCKECTKSDSKSNLNSKAYYLSEKGVVRTLYKSQKHNSKLRNHPMPDYTKEEFRVWLYDNGFKQLYDNWVSADYDKKLKPSVDRLDSFKPYTMTNIELITQGENRTRQYSDIREGTGTSGKRCKAVIQLSLTGEEVNRFHSQHEAMRQTGVDNRSISACCNGKLKSAGGYVWSNT